MYIRMFKFFALLGNTSMEQEHFIKQIREILSSTFQRIKIQLCMKCA